MALYFLAFQNANGAGLFISKLTRDEALEVILVNGRHDQGLVVTGGGLCRWTWLLNRFCGLISVVKQRVTI
jgi:hypothetical protein